MRLQLERLAGWLRSTLRPKRVLAVALTVIAVVALFVFVLPNVDTDYTASGHWETPAAVLLLGLIIGITYGVLAVGLVLIYRTNRIVNFAHGQFGAFGAAFFGIAVVKWHIPYWPAFVLALLASACVGIIAEMAVIRRLRKAPAVMSVVATLGVGQFLLLFSFAINAQAGASAVYPQPTFLPEFQVGPLLVTPGYSGMLFLSPLVVIALGVFLKYSRFGLGIRASAANPEAARMAGIFSSRMSSLAWALAGVLAAFTAILAAPTQGFAGGDGFGPSLLLVALTCAVLARMQSIPLALLAGIGIGTLEQLLLWNYGDAGLVQMVLFGIIVLAMLLQKQRVGRSEEKGSWAAVQPPRPLPSALRKLPQLRIINGAVLLVIGAAFLLAPQFVTNANAVKITGIFGFIIVGLSVGVMTGLGGQLSLGQFAFAAVGAVVAVELTAQTGNFVLAFICGGLASAVVSVLLGLPAIRARGLMLTVTTLAFALVMPSYLLAKDWAFGGGEAPGKPIFGNTVLDTGKDYYYVGLVTLLVALVLARNVRAGGLARRLIAVRDNEDVAKSFTVRTSLVKVQGFAIAGFIAGLGGAMYAHGLSYVGASTFPVSASIEVVVMAVIGGLGLLLGPFYGALVVMGVTFVPLDNAGLATSALGQLILIMYLPGGIGSVVTVLRDRMAYAIGRRAGLDAQALAAKDAQAPGADGPLALEDAGKVANHEVRSGEPLLQARNLRKSFGGVRAVRGASFDVAAGETLGLIGPNGAGKTTTFELLAGFTKVDEGSVTYAGHDVTRLSAAARGQRGLIRSFQDAALFPTLTVLECIELSMERMQPTRILPSVLGIRRQEKKKRANAEVLASRMGLWRYRNSQIQELSTGTRRIAELACLVALRPKLLLLDEPSSGLAQKETEALGALIRRLKRELDLTLVIIEHDIPLIMSLSDRIVCMADGEVIADGSPESVRNDEQVLEAYLGGSLTAIERSAGVAVPG